jgi:hypothetical protein
MDERETLRRELKTIVQEAETLDATTAARISQELRSESPLYFLRLKAIDQSVAACLSRIPCSMSFPEVREIDPATARSLMRGKMKELILDGIETVPLEVAKGFSQGFNTGVSLGHGTKLFLRGLKTVSPEVARQLKKCAFTTGEVRRAVDAAPESLLYRVVKVGGFIIACYVALFAFSKGCGSGRPF